MSMDEKCGICEKEILEEQDYFKLVMVETFSSMSPDEHVLVLVCYSCFTDIFLGGFRQRKGVAPWRVGDERPN